MKRLLLSSLLLCVTCLSAAATEPEPQALQEVIIDANKATPILVKQPASTNSIQKITITKNWFTLVVICNGKVPFEPVKNNN